MLSKIWNFYHEKKSFSYIYISEHDKEVSDMEGTKEKIDVRIAERPFISPREAASYFGIGINTVRHFANQHQEIILWVGNKMMIKRRKMEAYLENAYELETPK